MSKAADFRLVSFRKTRGGAYSGFIPPVNLGIESDVPATTFQAENRLKSAPTFFGNPRETGEVVTVPSDQKTLNASVTLGDLAFHFMQRLETGLGCQLIP